MDISAQVIFRTKSPITVENLSENMPPAGVAEEVMEMFRRSRFSVGPFVGISFSIAGPAELFERFFGVRLSDVSGYEFPLDSLPASVREYIATVTFTPPPAFGPGGTGP